MTQTAHQRYVADWLKLADILTVVDIVSNARRIKEGKRGLINRRLPSVRKFVVLPPPKPRTVYYRPVLPYGLHKPKTRCINGHELTPDNIYMTTKGYKNCRMCQRNFARKKVIRNSKPAIETCTNGHPWTETSFYRNNQGCLVCKQCRKDAKNRSKKKLQESRKIVPIEEMFPNDY